MMKLAGILVSVLTAALAEEYNEFNATFQIIENPALLNSKESSWFASPEADENSELCPPIPADFLWVVDGSRSMGINEAALRRTNWIKQMIASFLDIEEMGPNKTRMGFLEFSGHNSFSNGYFPILGDGLNLTDPIASSKQRFSDWMNSNFGFLGGSTNIPAALNHVREHMLLDTPDSRRRVVFLITDGAPTDSYGRATEQMLNATHEAAIQLKEEDDATLILVRVQGERNFPPGFLHGIADHAFDLLPGILNTLRVTVGLCRQPSNTPTTVPSNQPTMVPSNQPTELLGSIVLK